jgi:hypothetical protein
MHQGHFAVVNIHQKMMAERYKTEPKFVELAEVKPMMALALGATAVGYFPATGISSGDEVRNMFFNEDLGYQSKFSFCNYVLDVANWTSLLEMDASWRRNRVSYHGYM